MSGIGRFLYKISFSGKSSERYFFANPPSCGPEAINIVPFMEDYHLWIRMYAADMKITSMPDILYLFKMDRNTQKRRGGITYIKSELMIQKLLLDSGIISRFNYCTNIMLRCGGRLLPGSFRAFLYRFFFRQ